MLLSDNENAHDSTLMESWAFVQSKRPLWSKDVSYPQARRVAKRKNDSVLSKAFSRHSAGTIETIFGALTIKIGERRVGKECRL